MKLFENRSKIVKTINKFNKKGQMFKKMFIIFSCQNPSF